jgi:hypothetical protein
VARRIEKLQALATELRERYRVDVIVAQVDLSAIAAVVDLHKRPLTSWVPQTDRGDASQRVVRGRATIGRMRARGTRPMRRGAGRSFNPGGASHKVCRRPGFFSSDPCILIATEAPSDRPAWRHAAVLYRVARNLLSVSAFR